MDRFSANRLMSVGSRLKCGVLVPCVALGVLWAAPVVSAADKVDHTRRADQLREASKSRAQENLQYENTGDQNETVDRRVDYYSLGLMIQRLGAMIRQMEAGSQSGGMPSVGTGIASGPPPAYGAEGPTRKSVRVILEYRLLLNGNPRLKAGEVEDAGDHIVASVVTRDNSLVEKFSVDKKTGVWRPMNLE